ncbi:MAG: aminopeptidase P family protein [Anaerolineae bacterium]|nr:aminopeptidase P family protein [Anaerolineae bacterium]
MSLPISELAEDQRLRAGRLLEHLDQRRLNGVVLFDRSYILYYTGFAFIPTERPIAFVMNNQGHRALFVPQLEREHAKANAQVDQVSTYPEYPHDPHPMQHLSHLLREMSMLEPGAVIGADNDGYPWIFGYRGVPLSEMTGQDIRNVRAFIEDQMMIKSPVEIAFIREACRWGDVAHRLLQDYTAVGVTETEVSERASEDATRVLLETLGGEYRSASEYYYGAMAGYRGQIGRNAAIPHALANNITFEPGDTLVTGAASSVWGYNSELERTMFVGEPNDAQRHYFDHMLTLQTLAIEALAPGRTCGEIDLIVRAYYEQHDLMDFWKHHVGHAIGLRYHEAPFLDLGDATVIQPGMVFTVEPGLYVPSLGGFRHSDTILVTESGAEFLTDYPRDRDSLIIPL